MPARGGNASLTDANLNDVVAFIRELQLRAGTVAGAEGAAGTAGSGDVVGGDWESPVHHWGEIKHDRAEPPPDPRRDPRRPPSPKPRPRNRTHGSKRSVPGAMQMPHALSTRSAPGHS